MRVLGIDPGVTGAFALLEDGDRTVEVADMPVITLASKRQTRQISEDLVVEIILKMRPDIAWLEQVHAMPRQGVSSTFNFGCAFGLIRGVLAGLSVPREFISPQQWKRTFGLGPDKQASRLRAIQLFPNCASLFERKKDDGRAEAALLALHGVRHAVNGARPSWFA